MKRTIIITSIMLLMSAGVQAQQFNFSQQQTKVWELAKARTLAVAKAMPEDKYSYTPTTGVKSFGQQMTHMANSLLSMNTRFILMKSYSGVEQNAATMSKQQIIDALTAAFDEVITTLNGMTDSELLTQGKSHGAFPLTKWQSFLFMRDHITNHRAKAVLYLRLNGITPPEYGFN
ncbi:MULTISPECIES: DinB family protein [Roseivirga]|jgi:uncharacterized damage-inducible protein DinB|uniref:DinB family protein n=1 Tax=Roseivirga TaxID=290180 RepID=UPI00257F4582|nr:MULTISPECIES: DinB family protein [Roseivirga]MEC7754089.1 DinB family protein [Bacteroidota bacterium]